MATKTVATPLSVTHKNFAKNLNEVWTNLNQAYDIKLKISEPNDLATWVEVQMKNMEQILECIDTKITKNPDKPLENYKTCRTDPVNRHLMDAYDVCIVALRDFTSPFETFPTSVSDQNVLQCKLVTLSIIGQHTLVVRGQFSALGSPWPALHTLTEVLGKMERGKQ
jgi:hypothetical protein